MLLLYVPFSAPSSKKYVMVGWENWTYTYQLSQALVPAKLKKSYKIEKYSFFYKENVNLGRKHIEMVGFSTKNCPPAYFWFEKIRFSCKVLDSRRPVG